MNNKYAYVAAITNNLFIPCLIRSAQITKFKGRKYPFVVLVTKDITDKDIQLLEDFDIICKRIPYFVLNLYEFQSVDLLYYHNVAIHYAALSLIEYDKVFVFEADILLLTNCDILLETAEFRKNQYFICDFDKTYDCTLNQYSNEIFLGPETFTYLCKPNINIYKNFLTFCQKSNFKNDHQIIRVYFYNSIINNKNFFNNIKYIHFLGHPKIWEVYKNIPIIKDIFYVWNVKTIIIFFNIASNLENIKLINFYLSKASSLIKTPTFSNKNEGI